MAEYNRKPGQYGGQAEKRPGQVLPVTEKLNKDGLHQYHKYLQARDRGVAWSESHLEDGRLNRSYVIFNSRAEALMKRCIGILVCSFFPDEARNNSGYMKESRAFYNDGEMMDFICGGGLVTLLQLEDGVGPLQSVRLEDLEDSVSFEESQHFQDQNIVDD